MRSLPISPGVKMVAGNVSRPRLVANPKFRVENCNPIPISVGNLVSG